MTISVIGAGTYTVDTTDMTPTLHASTAEGDLLIAFANKRSSPDDQLNPPVGGNWEILKRHSAAFSGNVSEMTFYAKFAGAAESSPTFTAVGGSVGTIQILTVRGNFGSSIPALLSASADDEIFDTNIEYPALTVTDDNSLILIGGKKRESFPTTVTAGAVSGFTQVGERFGGATPMITVWYSQIQTTATNILSGQIPLTNTTTGNSVCPSIVLSLVELAAFLYPVMSPMSLGGSLLANKSGIKYRVTAGHTNLDGELLATGTNGTTDASGVFQCPTPIVGTAADPVTVTIYWEEGSDPVADRSLVVKTIIGAA